MFGLLRTTLALMVMVYHLYAWILPLGIYPVFGFYIISGYLMTLVMHESYGYTALGRASFATNRFLRLFPQYWAAAALTVLLIHVIGADAVRKFHPSMFVPTSLYGIVANVTMIFPAWYPNEVNPRLVPPTWALTVEMFFYLLICLGLSKTYARVKLWLALSVAYVLGSFAAGQPWEARYYPVGAASLPFSIGSAIYFAAQGDRVHSAHKKSTLSASLLFVLMLVNCAVWMAVQESGIARRLHVRAIMEAGFYLNLVICAFLVYALAKGERIFPLSQKLDRSIGDLSYPTYLFHWSAGLLVSFALFGEAFHERSTRGLISLLISMMAVVALTFVSSLLIDKPIQSVRARIKTNRALRGALVLPTVER